MVKKRKEKKLHAYFSLLAGVSIPTLTLVKGYLYLRTKMYG
jgi:hypothetical protein